MGLSSLSESVKRTCDVLRLGASRQVLDYEQRFSSLKNLYDSMLSNLIKTDFNSNDICETAKEFFKTSSVRFAGIDGTMYSRPLFDMVIFFGGAYASTGTVTFREREASLVGYDERTMQGAGISSVVPVYINEIPDIDQTFFSTEQPGEISLGKPLMDEAIVSNATIANSIMTFAEYYLAYKLATDPDQNVHIILLDRSLSIDRASLLYDTSRRELWEAKSSIIGYKIDKETIDLNDLTIARHYICNQALRLPPPRADYLRYAIIHLLERKGALSEKQILAEFGITDEKRAKMVNRHLNYFAKNGFLTEETEIYTLNPKYATIWERTKKLVTSLGDQLFFTKTTQNLSAASPMKILRDGKEHWLTTLDIAFLTLFTLHMLMEECWKKHILLVGITKDTAARDFKRQLIPIMHNEGLLKTVISQEEFERLPNTDRMILQSTSIFNPEKIKPPWGLIEYDSAFRTMVPDRKHRKGYVSGAIKNKIGLEKCFVKTYVQLSQAKTDPMLRSNVLLVDRLVYPEYDYKPENLVEFWNELSSGTREPVEAILFVDKSVPNRLQDLTMTVLLAMAPSNIPEAFGHNKPLFIADKIAKSNYSQVKRVVDTTADWILNNHKLRKFIFYMSTFRERRATIEAARREHI